SVPVCANAAHTKRRARQIVTNRIGTLLRSFLHSLAHLLMEETLRLDELVVRRGRPGLTGKTPRTYRRGYPAANSLSRIFVRIGYRLNGLPYTIPDSMPGSLDCAAGDCNPLLFRRHHLLPHCRRDPLYRLRNPSTTVMRRML